jgi:OmpA-OmpF porin, OOP family
MKKTSLCLALLGLAIQTLRAQNQVSETSLHAWSLAIRGGASVFLGDLQEAEGRHLGGPNSRAWTGGLGLNYQLSHWAALEGNLWYGQLAGRKANASFQRAGYTPAYFESTLAQFDMGLSINLKSLLLGTQRLRRWKTDFYVGAGMINYYTNVYSLGSISFQNSQSQAISYAANEVIRFSNRPKAAQPSAWPGGSNATWSNDVVIPVGLSIDYQLGKHWDIGVDFRLNHVLSDQLDMTVGGLDNSRLESFQGRLTNNSANDKWGFMGLHLVFKLGKNMASTPRQGPFYEVWGKHHQRWASPADVVAPAKQFELSEVDSVAKANMPLPVDSRLYTDTDGDGVADIFDKEPQTPRGVVVDGAGRTWNIHQIVNDLKVKRKAKKSVDVSCEALYANVEFEVGKANVPEDFVMLQNLNDLAFLLNVTDCRLLLVGHADSQDTDSYNMALAERRAVAVKKYLLKAGLKDANKVLIEFYGEHKPLAPNQDARGRQLNRRVEIKVRPAHTFND